MTAVDEGRQGGLPSPILSLYLSSDGELLMSAQIAKWFFFTTNWPFLGAPCDL